eukprot:499929-Amphidinium_carterae.2
MIKSGPVLEVDSWSLHLPPIAMFVAAARSVVSGDADSSSLFVHYDTIFEFWLCVTACEHCTLTTRCRLNARNEEHKLLSTSSSCKRSYSHTRAKLLLSEDLVQVGSLLEETS